MRHHRPARWLSWLGIEIGHLPSMVMQDPTRCRPPRAEQSGASRTAIDKASRLA